VDFFICCDGTIQCFDIIVTSGDDTGSGIMEHTYAALNCMFSSPSPLSIRNALRGWLLRMESNGVW
jgi:hypothetical protein